MPQIQESMRQLHRLYSNEVNECIQILNKSKEASSSIVDALEKCSQTNHDMHSMIVYDTYMSNLGKTMDLVRKLSLHLRFNELWNNLDVLKIAGSSVEEPPDENTSVKANANIVIGHEEQQQQQTPAAPHSNETSSADHSDSKILVTKPTVLPAEETTSSAGSTSDCSEWRFTYNKPDLSAYQPDDIIWATISYIADTVRLRFYIVVIANENTPKIAELANAKHLRQYSELPGNEVFGLAMDNVIYRAVRERLDEATKSSPDSTRVLLIDLGETSEIDNDSILYRLGTELQQIPGLAIPCEMYDPQGKCSYELQQMLQRLEFQKIECQIKAVRGDTLQIEIIDLPRAEPKKAALDVVKHSVPSSKAQNTKNPFYGELSAEDLEMLKEEPLGTTNAMKAVLGYNPKDDKRICPFYDPKINGCFKGANCQLEHTPKQPDGWTKDVEPDAKIGHDFAITSGFTRGAVISATVTNITDVDRFYANINDKQNPMEPLIWMPSFISEEKRLQRLPKIFEIVMARYQDGHWYRARVEETNELGNLVRVFYVDYGNEQLLHLSNLAHCDVGIAQLPYRAILCRIANVRKTAVPIENCKSGIHYLNQTLLNDTMDVKVVCDHEDLWISFTDDFHKGVVDELKRKGLLEACETIVI